MLLPCRLIVPICSQICALNFTSVTYFDLLRPRPIHSFSKYRAQFLCRKQTCTVTVIHHWTDEPQLIARCSRHRSIDVYRPTIVLIAAGCRSVRSMRWSQILAENPDFCLPHLYWTSPSAGGGGPVRILPRRLV